MTPACLALATALAWWAAWGTLEGAGGRLSVSVLDVGQGEAILIETPDGREKIGRFTVVNYAQ